MANGQHRNALLNTYSTVREQNRSILTTLQHVITWSAINSGFQI